MGVYEIDHLLSIPNLEIAVLYQPDNNITYSSYVGVKRQSLVRDHKYSRKQMEI